MTVSFLPGEIPELFSEEEIEGIVSAVRAEVRALGLLDSRENCWRFFTDRVRLQLTVFHIFLLKKWLLTSDSNFLIVLKQILS